MILLMVLFLFKCILSRKKRIPVGLCLPAFFILKFEIKKNWKSACALKLKTMRRKLFVFYFANRSLCYFPFSHLLSWGLMQLWFMWGYWRPRLNNTLHLCSAASLLSFTQLKRIKVCFSPNIITGYEMSHSGVLETQQWWRKNLFIRLWLPEHCPVETGGKQTHTQEGKENLNSYLHFISFFYVNTDVFTPVSVTL